MRKIVIICAAIMSAFSLYAQGDGIKFMDNPKWEEVLTIAAKEKKMIFLDCYTTWCGPCKGLSQNVFPQKKAGDYFNGRFINVKMDMEKGDGVMLNKKYKEFIPGYPTMLLISAEGKVTHRVVGFHEVDELISGVELGFKGKTLEVMSDRYAKGERSLEFIKEYLEVLNVAFMKDEMEALVKEYVSSLPEEKLKEKEIIELYLPYVNDIYSPQYTYILKNSNHYFYRLKEFDRYELSRKLNYAMSSAVRKVLSQKDSEDGKTSTIEPNVKEIAHIRELLNLYSFESKQLYLAQLRMHELKVAAEFNQLVNYMEVASDLGMFGSTKSHYYTTTFRYLACHTKDKALLKKSLTMLEAEEVFIPENKREQEFTLYRLLSSISNQLGIKEKVAKYGAIADKAEAVMREKYKEFFK